jgi:hypothetical protein
MKYLLRIFPRDVKESPLEYSDDNLNDALQTIQDTLQILKDHRYYESLTLGWELDPEEI